MLFCTISQHSSAPFNSTVAPFVGTVLHHSSAQFCTIRQLQFCTIRQFSSAPFVSYRSAPFISSVLHHSLATDLHHSLATSLRHVIMLFYNSASSNNLATDANTHCRLFNCITKSYFFHCCLQNISPYLSTHLFYCRDSASLTIASSRCSAALKLTYLSILSSIDTWSSPFGRRHSSFVFLHSFVKYYFPNTYLCTLTIKFIFVCCCVCFYSPLLW